jgi:hypothetical protein
MFVAGDAPILAAMRASDTVSIVMTLAAIRSQRLPYTPQRECASLWQRDRIIRAW